MEFKTIDIIVMLAYIISIVSFGLLISRNKKGTERNSSDYFLAGNTLPWWAIGASVIASNISAEQFVGMSGSGFAVGLGMASYEWMGAIALLVVAKFFLPVFLKKKIYTMPQFLEQRFDSRVKTSLAIFWILLYVFINITSVLYLGALVMRSIIGIDLVYSVIILALIALAYSVYGGLKAVAWTDVVQVVFLSAGGLLMTYLALNAISENGGILKGLNMMMENAPEKFDMILSRDNPNFKYLPGISVLVGGMWMANLYYFGCNQYIIQRALAAKNLSEAQKGMAFAGILKLFLPLLVVIPGIAAFVLKADIQVSDEAYPWLLHAFVGPGLKGLIFAALVAAIVSSLSSMANSTSTIFTMDIYRSFIHKQASEKQLVRTGRIAAAVSIIIGVILAPVLKSIDQVFQFIQDFTGYITPGIVTIFLAGLFYKKASSGSALWAAILSIPVSILLDALLPGMAFMNRVVIVFLVLAVFIVIYSKLDRKKPSGEKLFTWKLAKTNIDFNIMAFVILGLLAVVYALFW